MSRSKEVQEWFEVHSQLISLETEFTELALDASQGKVSRHELEQRRAFLVEARLYCSEAYKRAFPRPLVAIPA